MRRGVIINTLSFPRKCKMGSENFLGQDRHFSASMEARKGGGAAMVGWTMRYHLRTSLFSISRGQVGVWEGLQAG